MYKVLTVNTISKKGLSIFPESLYRVSDQEQDPHVILVRSAHLNEKNFSHSLQAIGRSGSGVNNIPVEWCTDHGIPVFHALGANANAVKELVLASMFCTARLLFPAFDFVRAAQGSAQELENAVEAQKKSFVGTELYGKVLGVVGLGHVGVQVANAAVALGMSVRGFDPSISIAHAWHLSPQVQKTESLSDLCASVDFLTVHVPLLPETQNLIDEHLIRCMKQDVVVLNFARPGIVCDEIIKKQLDTGAIRAYVTDFPSVELKNHAKVISFPHLGASTAEAEEHCSVVVASKIRAYLETGMVSHAVNFPNVRVDFHSKNKIIVINRNVPNVISKICSVLSEHHFNILDMVNQSKNKMAYNIIALSSCISDGLCQELQKIPDVLRVRVLPSESEKAHS